MTDWLAAALGLAGGLGLAWWVAGAALPRLMERSRRPELLAKLAFGGAIGVALVFALVLLAGTFGGALLAAFLSRQA